jgi:transposase
LVLRVQVHDANVMDRDSIKPLMELVEELFPRLSHLWLDASYNGQSKGEDWVEKTLGWTARYRPAPAQAPIRVGQGGEEPDWEKLRELLPPPGFRVLPRRWVVERTFSWIGQNRRMSKDYEKLAATSEAFILIAMTHPMVRRLARS